MRYGSHINPPNRFEAVHREDDLEHLEWDQEYAKTLADRNVQYLPDASKTIVSENESPDIPFRYSLNPYRGCRHGCAYCYARPTHEFLGMSGGLDFETKILVKHRAPDLFRRWLSRRSEAADVVMLSGATDCYQPCERRFRLTRQCLEVALEAGQPISIVTKNALVLRDLDLLRAMAVKKIVRVMMSLTTLDPELARSMEPCTSIPEARLRAIRELNGAGVPVGVMAAPVIPGLTDAELPAVLKAAAGAGAQTAGYQLLRLPLSVEPIFLEWLERTLPTIRRRVEARIRATRDGALSEHRFGHRMRGSGEVADSIRGLFHVFASELGLDRQGPQLDRSGFRPPRVDGQRWLFHC